MQDFPLMEEVISPDTNPEQEKHNENLAEKLDEDVLVKLGDWCSQGFQSDLDSRHDWDDAMDTWISLAKQEREQKSFPWRNASNVKYPLITTAAMQFAARAYPSLVPSNGKIVKSIVIGKDPTGQKYDRGQRVADYMSYQIMHEMDGWEEDMDKMLMQLPVVGTMFKKTWFNKNKNCICSKIILPKHVVVDYWAKNLESVERISEILYLSPRLLKEYQNQGIYLEVDLGEPSIPEDSPEDSSIIDGTVPYELVEQHTFYDLDEDGYPEPYIVTFERRSSKVLSVYRRYDIDGVVVNGEKIVKISPTQMYTKFGFVPNPDGSFYDIGFGVLLGPLNESVNTVINQLIDSGSLANLQGGFIGKGLKLKSGDTSFQLGEWKPVNVIGDDIKKNIFPIPTKEPSTVLFQLLQSLITSGKELASVAEIFVGKMPGQNTPATTTMASIEQGMKVFTAVYKRVFRSLSQEFKKIYKLNAQYMDPYKQVAVLDVEMGPADFNNKDYDICPGADPTAVSQTEKLLKAQGLLELMPMVPGMLDPIKVFSRVLEAQEQPNWQELFAQAVQASGQLPPPAPDPKLMAIQAKMQADQQKTALDLQAKQMDMELNARDKEMQLAMKQQEHAQKMQQQSESTQLKAASDIAMANIFASAERMKGSQQLQQAEASHQQKMAQQKEAASSQQRSKSGSSTQSLKNTSTKSDKGSKK
jgi:chaperonin GroES